MRRETTTSRVATRPAPSRPASMLFGTLYGMAGGLALALVALSGLLPVTLPAEWVAMPLAFQGALTGVAALFGALVSFIREEN